jgi:hypothetical protein
MNRKESIQLLKCYQRWRMGEDDDLPMPETKEISKAINYAIDDLENKNKVTVNNLDATLRMCSIEFHTILLERIIDVVYLIQDKGDKVNIEDVVKLQIDWNNKSVDF